MSEILTEVRGRFIKHDPEALKIRAVHIQSAYDFYQKDAWPIENPALNWVASESSGARVADSHSRTEVVKTLRTRMILGAKYPEIHINEVPWVRGRGILTVVPFPLDNKSISPHFLACGDSAYQYYSYFYCHYQGENQESRAGWYPRVQACIMQKCPKDRHFSRTLFHQGREIGERDKFLFPGLIPPSVKQKIGEAMSDFKSGDRFLLVDASTLVLIKNFDPDPLAVGWHPDVPDSLWLIDAFDMTTVEQAINDEALAKFKELHDDTAK